MLNLGLRPSHWRPLKWWCDSQDHCKQMALFHVMFMLLNTAIQNRDKIRILSTQRKNHSS